MRQYLASKLLSNSNSLVWNTIVSAFNLCYYEKWKIEGARGGLGPLDRRNPNVSAGPNCHRFNTRRYCLRVQSCSRAPHFTIDGRTFSEEPQPVL